MLFFKFFITKCRKKPLIEWEKRMTQTFAYIFNLFPFHFDSHYSPSTTFHHTLVVKVSKGAWKKLFRYFFHFISTSVKKKMSKVEDACRWFAKQICKKNKNFFTLRRELAVSRCVIGECERGKTNKRIKENNKKHCNMRKKHAW